MKDKSKLNYWLDRYMVDIDCREGQLSVDLCYPRIDDGRPSVVEVGLSDVRAADSIQISYDFSRDGWSIKQASTFEWDGNDPDMNEDWAEVSFIPAWGREKKVSAT